MMDCAKDHDTNYPNDRKVCSIYSNYSNIPIYSNSNPIEMDN